jgi:Fibronectin type III domain
MPTLYGAWEGTPYQARIYCVYNVSYTADHTQAIFSISFGIEFEGSVSDSTNTWAVSGDCGSASGSNISYSIPSGGGTKVFRSGESAQKYGDASVAGSVTGINAVGGGTINGSFTLESGALAPYFTDSTYSGSSITSTGATIGTWAAAANGGTLNNVQIQRNTSATDVGATTITKGSYGTTHALTGLSPATTYYVRVRVSNSTYGYGAWGPWVAFTTAATIPSAPSDAWYFSSVNQTDISVAGITVPYNGGAALDQILVRYSTDPAFGTYTDIPLAGTATGTTISNLNPGTVYYVRVYAHNAIGYGPPSADKSTTTLPGVLVNVGGVWKTAVPYVNVNGIWKPATRYVNVGGVWKQ